MMIRWSDVHVGDSVQDQNGDVWKVAAISPSGADMLVDLSGQRDVAGLRVPAFREVMVVLRPEAARTATVGQSLETATAVTQVYLGGRLSALPAPDGRGHLCPVEYRDLGSLIAHMRLFHLHIGDLGPDAGAWEAEHTRLHAAKAPAPHVHTPEFARR